MELLSLKEKELSVKRLFDKVLKRDWVRFFLSKKEQTKCQALEENRKKMKTYYFSSPYLLHPIIKRK